MSTIENLQHELDTYREIDKERQALVREIDTIINGAGAAPQASLIDLVGQIKELAQYRRRYELIMCCSHDRHHKGNAIMDILSKEMEPPPGTPIPEIIQLSNTVLDKCLRMLDAESAA